MPKTPLSVTIDDSNLMWLRARAASRKRRSLSAALDDILTEARLGGHGSDVPRSVVGTVDIAEDDPDLQQSDAVIRAMFDESARRPIVVREPQGASSPRTVARKLRRG